MIGIFMVASASASDLDENLTTMDNEVDELVLTDGGNFHENSPIDSGKLSVNEESDVLSSNFTPKNPNEIQTCVDSAKDNDTIILDGTYILQSTIRVNKSLTFIGINDATVDGSSNMRLFSLSDSGVIFKNITFINGHSDEGAAIHGDCTVINCTFINNSVYGDGSTGYNYNTGQLVTSKGRGGALYGGTAFDCTFINNSAGNQGGSMYGGNANNCTFINNSAYDAGGALYGGDASNCIFINNSVTATTWVKSCAGGAISGGSAFNSTFINNSAGNKGGAIFGGDALNCTFVNNSALAGGAIFDSDAVNCTFIENTAQFTYAGNQYGPGYDTSIIYSGGALCKGSAENCTFINNSADYGGAIYKCSAVNCVFMENNATDGGAIYVDSEYYLLDNCSFVNNHATKAGGALYYNYDCENIQNCVFENNSALNQANEIFINSSMVYSTYSWVLKITNCTFTNCVSHDGNRYIEYTNRKNTKNYYISISKCRFINCSSDRNGGAICLVNITSFTVDDCYFEGNSAINGGAIYCDEHLEAINNCYFKNNIAQYGGAIFYQNYNEVVNCSFENNTATKKGSDIFINESSEITLIGCNFTNSISNGGGLIGFDEISSFSCFNCNFINCSSNGDGGAIYLSNIISSNIINSYFEGNSVGGDGYLEDEYIPVGGAIYLESISKCNISNCSFIKNDACQGGAIYIMNSSNCFIDKCTFEDNSAFYGIRNGLGWNVYGEGGAIFIHDSKDFIVRNSNFKKNHADYGSGGSIMGNCTIINSNFTQCNAMRGAAMSNCHAINCTFIENNVWGFFTGGALYDSTAVNCIFKHNSGNYGSAMYGGTAVNCTFIDNNARVDGGAMCGGNAVGCSFVNNSAEGYGGAMCGGNAVGCSFVNNSAEGSGGAIYGGKTSITFDDGEHNPIHVLINNCTVENCEFINCSANNKGGAIYCNAGGNLNVSRCSFENCSSGNGSYLGCDENTINFNISDSIFDVNPEGIDFMYNSILSVDDVNIIKGENGILIANLSDIRGQLSNKTIYFTVNGDKYNSTTDENGLAIFNFYEYLGVGHYNVDVSFLGDGSVYPISTNASIFIYSYKGILMISQNGKYYDDVVLSLKLIDSKTNVDISNATVKVEFSNGEIVYLKTDYEGIARYSVPFAPGTYSANASVYDDNVDVNNVTLSDIVINNIDGLMKVTQVDNTMLNVRLYNPSNGDAYKNINVTLKFENMDPVYVVTNNQGIATYTMDFDYGTYSVLAFVSKPYTNIAAVSVDDIVIKEDNSYATVTFSSGIIFEYGTSGSIYVTVKGGSIDEENIKVLNHPEAKITLVKNVITVSNLNPGVYTLSVVSTPFGDLKPGNGTVGINVKKATAVIKAQKITVALKKGSQWTIQLVNSKTGKPISNMVLALKVFTGKKYKIVTIKTNSKGEAKYQTKGLTKGNHKVIISAKDSRYNFNTLTSSIKVVKQTPLKFKLKQKVDDKDGSLRSYMVLNKKTKKGVNGIKIKVLIYTGKKYKAYTFKTKKIKGDKGTYNGAFGFATNKFKAGKHKVKIMPASIKYKGSITTYIKLSKKATGKNVPKFMREI